MKYSRTKNAMRNIIWGTLNKATAILFPFVNRTIIIYVMGLEYAGLDSLFLSVLKVLNLAELGVGTALTYTMYKPIAENDKAKVCAIMKYYKKCYRLISLVVLVLGIVLLPFLRSFIKGDVPEGINIYILYIMYVMQNVVSYNLFAYKNSLLAAHQRLDIGHKISIALNVIIMALQAVVILMTKNYYLYVLLSIISVVALNIIQAFFAQKLYPEYKCEGELADSEKHEIKKQVMGLLTNKIGATVINSADTIIISAFLGLAVLACYDNYYYCLAAVIAFLDIVLSSMTAGVGNSIVTETKEKNKETFENVNFMYSWVVCCCAALLMSLYQPFITLWVGEDKTFPLYVVALLVFRFFAGRISQVTFMYKDALGMWWEDKYRPIVSAICNLIINIILVNIIGISGVIISTFVCSIFISTPWGNIILFKNYFGNGLKEYFIGLLRTYLVGIVTVLITYMSARLITIDGVIGLVLTAIISFIVSNIVLLLFNFRRKEFVYVKERIVRKFK